MIFGILFSKAASAQDDILQWTGKSIMVFAPHPDDELFCMGTLAKLVKAGNTVRLVIYTNGNKGSNDPDMTSERLAAIRKKEDIAANKIIGIPVENLINLGYDDGELEYVPQKELVEKVCKIIRTYRPDAVFGYDPGLKYTRWHKSDHRMAALITLDGVRAAPFHLYFPQHKLNDNLEPHSVPEFFFFGSYEPNLTIDISDVFDLKCEAIYEYSSQFGKGSKKYQSTMDEEDKEQIRTLLKQVFSKDGKPVETFHRTSRLPDF